MHQRDQRFQRHRVAHGPRVFRSPSGGQHLLRRPAGLGDQPPVQFVPAGGRENVMLKIGVLEALGGRKRFSAVGPDGGDGLWRNVSGDQHAGDERIGPRPRVIQSVRHRDQFALRLFRLLEFR